MVVDLIHAAGAGFTILSGDRHERLWRLGRFRQRLRLIRKRCFLRRVALAIAQLLLDHTRRLHLHLIGDMAINIQRRVHRHMADHGGERLDVHAVF